MPHGPRVRSARTRPRLAVAASENWTLSVVNPESTGAALIGIVKLIFFRKIRCRGLTRKMLPAILQLQPDIVRVAPAQLVDGISDPEMNGLNGCNQVGRHRPVSTYL